MTRSEALEVILNILDGAMLVQSDPPVYATTILEALDPALRFDPEIRNFSGTATAVSRVK